MSDETVNRPPSVWDQHEGKIVILQLAEHWGAVTAPGRPFMVEQEQLNRDTNEKRVVQVRPALPDVAGVLSVHPDGAGGISLTLTGFPDPDQDQAKKGSAVTITIPDPKIIAFCTQADGPPKDASPKE